MKKSKFDYPQFLTCLTAIELIHGTPETILSYSDFFKYQKWMSQTMIDLPGTLMGAEMGLGKTPATLYALNWLFENKPKEYKTCLIIAPLHVSEDTWPEEIAKWDFARGLTYRVVTGNERQRIASLKYSPAQITIINRENLIWLYKILGKKWKFDVIVYDEASRLKGGLLRTKPAKPKPVLNEHGVLITPPKKKAGMTELGVLHRVRHITKKTIELTGTPSPNGLHDLYGPIFALDGGKRLGESMYRYKERWFKKDQWSFTETAHDWSEEEIMGRLQDIFFSLREEDYVELPPMIPVPHNVRLSKKEMKHYRELEKELVLEVDGRWDEPEFIEAANSGVLYGKLLQFANGSLYREDKTSLRIHDRKLKVLESIIEEANGKPVIVSYTFKFDLEAIKKKFKYARVYGTTKNDMRDWNDGKIKLMIVHPASAGHGLNFQYGSNIAVWYGPNWSLELTQQFNKRLHRRGQKSPNVFIHQIIAVGTVDEVVIETLKDRDTTQKRITEAVRVRLENMEVA